MIELGKIKSYHYVQLSLVSPFCSCEGGKFSMLKTTKIVALVAVIALVFVATTNVEAGWRHRVGCCGPTYSYWTAPVLVDCCYTPITTCAPCVTDCCWWKTSCKPKSCRPYACGNPGFCGARGMSGWYGYRGCVGAHGCWSYRRCGYACGPSRLCCVPNCGCGCGIGCSDCCGGTVISDTPVTDIPPTGTPTPAPKADEPVPAPETPSTDPAPVPELPTPGPAMTTMAPGTAIISLAVPSDAKVYVNGRLSTSTGPYRHYVSEDLKPGFRYTYTLRATMLRDGKPVEMVKTVKVSVGDTARLAFTYDPASMKVAQAK